MNDPIIVVENLCKRFGGFTAVDSLSFRIRTGEIVAFLGPNGAGKTTTLKMLTGLLPPTSGKMTIGGYDGTKERKKVKSLLGYMSQKFSLYPPLTAGENLEFFA
ncbi:MAG TPA: ABC transporter ATP-binding protein, partial [Candidatus Aminicenantes bacterium]|nr:ABC transporter ATP-binding protein [Candidatus Aminicenantes bacterium]